jgi:RNA polymerase sigma factor (sigma-70 family)
MNRKQQDNKTCEFEELMNSAMPKVRSYFSKRIYNHDDIDDLVQEVFYGAWKNRDQRKGEFIPWIFGISKNVLGSYLKMKSKLPDSLEEETVFTDGKADSISDSLTYDRMLEDLRDFNPKSHKVFVLAYYEGMDFEKITLELRISLPNAYYHYKKAIDFMRKWLSNNENILD